MTTLRMEARKLETRPLEAQASITGRLAATARTWRPAYALAALAMASALAVAPITGHSPDVAGTLGVASELSGLLVFALVALVAYRFVLVARARPAEGPTRALVSWFVAFAAHGDRWLHAIHAVVTVTVFALAFGLLKGAIAILVPFHLDAALIEADRFLHFGRLPHEWLWPLLASPTVLFATNLLYNLWYFIVLGAVLLAGMSVGRDVAAGGRHMRFVVSFMAAWLFGGFYLATLLSSAGPCFAGPAGISTEYEGLMAALREAHAVLPIWALEIQDVLWAGHVGERAGSLGISAMPSLHVATSVLLALYVQGFGRAAALAGWAFAAAIMLGSVLLAWHYAVDGYAGGLMAWGLWWAAGRFVARPAA